MGDHTMNVPAHQDDNVLPAQPLFNRLVRFAHDIPPRLCVRDDNAGTEATHIQLLTDVLAFRRQIWTYLSTDVRRALAAREEVYIAVLAAGSYEYTVAMLATLALGAAVVPMTVALPPPEALYFVTKSRAAAILVSSAVTRLAVALEKLVKENDVRSTFICIPIAPALFTSPVLRPNQIFVSSDRYIDPNAPGVVIFTSGTTGPPKGAVMRLGFTYDTALAVADHYNLGTSDTMLHVLPVHHATGIGINFFPCLKIGRAHV